MCHLVRDRPFNMQRGVMVFCFVQNFFFRTTQELEYYYFLSRNARIFFPQFNIRFYDKNWFRLFFFLHQNQNIFYSNIGNQNIFLEKNHNPPFKLNGPSLNADSPLTLWLSEHQGYNLFNKLNYSKKTTVKAVTLIEASESVASLKFPSIFFYKWFTKVSCVSFYVDFAEVPIV